MVTHMCHQSAVTLKHTLYLSFPVEQSSNVASQTFGDVLKSEQSHPGVTVHRPFLGFTVWLTAMVHEASLVPFGAGINDPVLEKGQRRIKRIN